MQHIFRVGEITRALKDVVEGQFPFVWVRGQVSNLARPASGHVYFSLKDEEAVLSVVWFKGSRAGVRLSGQERYDPLTGEVLAGETGADNCAWLANGADVLCAGRLTVYPPRGAYQMVAELVQDMGLGRLYLEFEALKARLAALGWFDADRKRPLPPQPGRVAVVTAPSGAAIRDFLRVGGARGTGCEIRIFPALVQGEAAPGQIAEALDAACADGWAEVAVLIRGGGSIEDLWAFNTEIVAGAIHRCPVPVVSGVGHEVDTTIADLVADVRAATPSHAAQLLWPERAVMAQRVDETEIRLRQAFSRFIGANGERLAGIVKALAWLSPRERLTRLAERLEDLTGRLERGGRVLAGDARARLATLEHRFNRLSPTVTGAAASCLEECSRRLESAGERWLARAGSGLDLLGVRLGGLDPHGPLERGYALARKADGTFLSGVDQVRPGDELDIIVRDGTVKTDVRDVARNSP